MRMIGGVLVRGKGMNSNYIITRIFATDYFHSYSNPAYFAAYFFPFIAYGKGRAYFDDEFEEKLKNIRENRHGNFYNYATQGFGNAAFYEPYITFEYFYKRLCLYHVQKDRYFRVQGAGELESLNMKNDLLWVLQKDHLLLKREVEVSQEIKDELIADLEKNENKYVLAKLLYYIVHERHMLPDVASQVQKDVADRVGLAFDVSPNICMGFRKTMDEDVSAICERIKKASQIQLLMLDGISMVGNEDVAPNLTGFFFNNIKKAVAGNSELKLEIIISEPGTECNRDASRYQINLPHLRLPKEKLAQYSLAKLADWKGKIRKGIINIKTTSVPLPYGMFIVCFEDQSLDYIKVDIYSPFLDDNRDRPTMYVLRRANPDLFMHFKQVFENMWKSDEFSRFI